jgi:hypothetical protein
MQVLIGCLAKMKTNKQPISNELLVGYGFYCEREDTMHQHYYAHKTLLEKANVVLIPNRTENKYQSGILTEHYNLKVNMLKLRNN